MCLVKLSTCIRIDSNVHDYEAINKMHVDIKYKWEKMAALLFSSVHFIDRELHQFRLCTNSKVCAVGYAFFISLMQNTICFASVDANLWKTAWPLEVENSQQLLVLNKGNFQFLCLQYTVTAGGFQCNTNKGLKTQLYEKRKK